MDTFSLLKLLSRMESSFHSPFSFLVLYLPSTLQLRSVFLVYTSALRQIFARELQDNEFEHRSSSSHSIRRTLSPYTSLTVPRKPDMRQLMQNQQPQLIALAGRNEKVTMECMCFWKEENHLPTNSPKSFHFHCCNYKCRCSSCAEGCSVDPLESLLPLLSLFSCISKATDTDSPGILSQLVSYEEMEALQADIAQIAATSDHMLLPKIMIVIDTILQGLDRKGEIILLLLSLEPLSRYQRTPGKMKVRDLIPSTDCRRESTESLDVLTKRILVKLNSQTMDHPWNEAVEFRLDPV